MKLTRKNNKNKLLEVGIFELSYSHFITVLYTYTKYYCNKNTNIV